MFLQVVTTLIINLMLLLSMSFFQQMIPDFKNSILKKVVIGLYSGVVGIVLMSVPFEFYEGMIFDTRSILITSTGIFFGVIPTSITWLFLISYRLIIGGSGVLAAFINITQAAVLALLFRRYKVKNSKIITNSVKDFIIIAYAVHIIMFLIVFTLPVEERNAILPHLWYMVLIILPIGSVLINLFHKYQINLDARKNHIIQYRDLFENSHVSLLLIDPENAKIVDANKTATAFYGWKLDELTSMYMYDISTSSKEDMDRFIELCMKKKKNYFEVNHITKTKKVIPVEIHSGPVLFEEKILLLSTVLDATMKVENQKLMVEKQKNLEYIGYHDHLTGLYNRSYLDLELRRLSTKRQLPLSVIVGDLNNLKMTNDKYSHFDGDKLLIEVANIIKESVRMEDIVARWGGDEFVILLPQSNEHIVGDVLNRIKRNCKKSKSKIPPSISLGYHTQRKLTDDIYEGIKKAETLMYQQKSKMKKEMISNSKSA